MNVVSRGYATDLMLASFEGEVLRRDGYVVVRTPSCPAFWRGNFVLFAEPPQSAQRQEWEAIFDRELAQMHGIRHRHFAWDRIDEEVGAAGEFVEGGYELNREVFLMATRVYRSSRYRTDVTVRPIDGDVEWRRALEVQLESLDPQRDTPGFRAFQAGQMARHRRLVGLGAGKWFGAFDGGELAATMGVFVQNGLARCQAVATAPRHRRQGICSTLVHDVCAYAFEHLRAREIVIMTDVENPAARVYSSVGFVVRERVSSLSMSRPQAPTPPVESHALR